MPLCIGGAKVYNLGGLKGEGAYVTDYSLTMHLFFGSAPQDTQILGGFSPPKPVIRAAYAVMSTVNKNRPTEIRATIQSNVC